jgi:hypothetical protein
MPTQQRQEVAAMTVAPHPAEVRKIVVRTFLEFGANQIGLSVLDENLIVDQGKCVARSYRTSELFAMWLIGVGIVQFYDAEGNMLRTVNLLQEQRERRMAA